MTLTFIQGHWSARKQKLLCHLSHESFKLIWMECGMLLRLVDVMNFMLILSCLFSIQGREHYIYYFIKKNYFNISLYSDIYRPISFKHRTIIKTTKLYILMSCWDDLVFICHSCIRKQNLWCPFSHKYVNGYGWNSVCCHNLLVCWSACCCDVMKCAVSIVICHDTCEPICFRLGVMLNSTKLYSLVPVRITQGHRVTGNVQLVQSFCS